MNQRASMSPRAPARAALLPWLLSSAACAVPFENADPMPVNACDSAFACSPEATCAEVGRRFACVSTAARLPGLILEIRPRAMRDRDGEVSYLISLADQGFAFPSQAPDGQVHRFDPTVPALASVKTTLRLAGTYCDGRVSGDRFPVKAEFRRVPSFQGLPAQSYTSLSQPESAGGQRIELAIPTGDYHLYLVPQAHEDCVDDLPPPIFLPNQSVPEVWAPPISAEAPRVLEGNLQVPQNMSVHGWKLDLVDSLTGSVISQVDVLEQDALDPRVKFKVKFYWTDPKAYTPIIRLRPAEGIPRPTVYWELVGVALQGSTANVNLSLSDVDAGARRVEGRVLDRHGRPVHATIRIQSATISPNASTAAYKLDTETDADGAFHADLPPGEYRLFAQPLSDTTKAITQEILHLPAGDGCYCGQSILMPDSATMGGRAHGPAGEMMDGAGVFATPAIVNVPRFLDRVLGPEPLLPRQASTTLRQGEFAFDIDPGEFDFSVRPPSGRGYPWLVKPRLSVPPGAEDTELGALTLPYPAVLQGILRDAAGAPLGDALVKAWLPIEAPRANGSPAGVIQIGEVRSGPDGSYVLPLPPSTSD